ncbi:PMP-22/EMP/MP20/Claudin family multipass membrane protein [Oleiphilus messinensis]|uniref:PMP-22/EMP/MP20/Claudin family multipass membrane protein n=1 Tax=Oleiphilus messinensis TaxID=141451 RepID=A0A1Y0IFW9_9GAMM|nr:hypothetical protein [Oleiphilus messinensis]ARU59130.1 PMP-22/EMP/MP20/Claudin family multipass membrane protein [Oleiphilus messinensis]
MTSPTEVRSLSNALAKNHHCIVVMSPEEFLNFAITQKRNQGMTNIQVSTWLDSLVANSEKASSVAKAQWNQNKATVKEGGAYLPVLSDLLSLAKLAREMHKGGHILSKYSVKTYNGREYVLLKGYPGLRSQLTGTRYLASNPKVVSMGIGKLGASNAIRGGVGIAVVFTIAFHSIEQLMNDKATWHDFVGGVSVDLASIAVGSGIAWGAVATVVGTSAMVAIGPIAIVVVVGMGITVALNAIGDHYRLSDRLAELLKESEQRMRHNISDMKREVMRGLNYADEDPVGFFHRLFGVPYFGYQ